MKKVKYKALEKILSASKFHSKIIIGIKSDFLNFSFYYLMSIVCSTPNLTKEL